MDMILAFIVGFCSIYFLIFMLVLFEHKLKKIYGEQYHIRLESFELLSNKQFTRAYVVIVVIGIISILIGNAI